MSKIVCLLVMFVLYNFSILPIGRCHVDIVLYIGLGILDALAMLLLIMKLFKLPIWTYRYKIGGFVLFIAVFSYIIRIVLEVPQIDLPLQYILFALFLRLAVKIKLHLAAFMCGAGITAYAVLQMVLYFIFQYTGIMSVTVVQQSMGWLVYLLQATSILSAYLISYGLYRFNLGFSFIPSPPHDFYSKEDYLSDHNYVLVIGNVISVITICLTLVLLYRANPLGLLVLAIMNYAMLYYFSKRREDHDS